MPKTLEEIHKLYREWKPTETEDFDKLTEDCKFYSMCSFGLMQKLHPLEQMIVIAYLMAAFVHDHEPKRGFDGLLSAAEDMLADMDDGDEAGADAGANTSD